MFVSQDWWASLHDFCPLKAALPGRGRALPPFSPPRRKIALSSWCRAGLLFLKPKGSVDGIRALPVVPSDLIRAKGWCLDKTPSFGAALGLSVTSILSAWGTTLKETASEAHLVPMHPGLPGRVQGAGWLHQPLVLRRNEGVRCLEGYVVSLKQSAAGWPLCLSCRSRVLNLQPLSLPAGPRHSRWSSLYFSHPHDSRVACG